MVDRPKVLVADDEPDIVVLCQVNLEFDGFSTVTATNGMETLERLEDDRPDAIVLDLCMRPFDGWHVLDALAAAAHWRDIPVVVLTAQVSHQVQADVWALGIAGFVPKPFIPASLGSLLRQVIAEPIEARHARAATESDRLHAETSDGLAHSHGAPRTAALR